VSGTKTNNCLYNFEMACTIYSDCFSLLAGILDIVRNTRVFKNRPRLSPPPPFVYDTVTFNVAK